MTERQSREKAVAEDVKPTDTNQTDPLKAGYTGERSQQFDFLLEHELVVPESLKAQGS